MATNKTIQPSGVTIVVPDFDEKPDARTFAQDISKLADNDNEINRNCMKCAKLETTVTINYSDASTIGFRTTDSTKVPIRYLSGYPTGKTILGAVAYPKSYIYGAILWIDESESLRGVTKIAETDLPVTILVFYKEPSA